MKDIFAREAYENLTAAEHIGEIAKMFKIAYDDGKNA